LEGQLVLQSAAIRRADPLVVQFFESQSVSLHQLEEIEKDESRPDTLPHVARAFGEFADFFQFFNNVCK
jgi:hypothetical protein